MGGWLVLALAPHVVGGRQIVNYPAGLPVYDSVVGCSNRLYVVAFVEYLSASPPYLTHVFRSIAGCGGQASKPPALGVG